MGFFKDLLSSSSDTSSKRFAALVTLTSVISLAYIATFKDTKWVCPEFMFNGLIIIAGSGLGLTVIEKIFGKKDVTQTSATVTPPVPDPPAADPTTLAV